MIALHIDIKNLTIAIVFSKHFKIGRHSETEDYTHYQKRSTVGAFGLGFVTIYYSKTTNY